MQHLTGARLLCGELPVGVTLPDDVESSKIAAQRYRSIALVPGATRTLRCIGGHPELSGAVSPLCGGGSDRVWKPLRFVMRDDDVYASAGDKGNSTAASAAAGAAARCTSAKIARVEGCTVDTAAPVVVRGVKRGAASLLANVIGKRSTSNFTVAVNVVRLREIRILSGSLTRDATTLLVNSSRKLRIVGVAEDGVFLFTVTF